MKTNKLQVSSKSWVESGEKSKDRLKQFAEWEIRESQVSDQLSLLARFEVGDYDLGCMHCMHYALVLSNIFCCE